MTAARYDLINKPDDVIGNEWESTKAQLVTLRDYLAALESELERRYFPNAGDEPTLKRALGGGWELKRTGGVTTSLDKKRAVAAHEKLVDDTLLSVYADKVLKVETTYKLDKREYNAAPDNVKAVVAGAIVETRKKPRFELIMPKGE